VAGIKVTMCLPFTILTVLTLFLLWVPAVQVMTISGDSQHPQQQHDEGEQEIEVDAAYTTATTTTTTTATESVAPAAAAAAANKPHHLNNLSRNVSMISLSKDLGDLGFSGLTNQRCMLFSVVNQAVALGAVLDVSSIRYRGAWNESSSLPHEELYDVEYWNRYATDHPNSLPLLVRGAGASSTSTNMAYATIRLDLSFVDSYIMEDKRLKELARHLYLALRPSRGVQDIIDELKPRGDYGAIHLRIEEDLKSAVGFWERRLTVRNAFDRLKASTDVTDCVEKYSSQSTGQVTMFVAVSIDDVTDDDDLLVLGKGDGPWPASRLVFDSTKENAKKMFGRRAGIVSALVDFEISRTATLFAAGHFELSTFSRAIGDTRLVLDAADDGVVGSFGSTFKCRSLFFDYSSNRTLRELFKQQPTPQFRPKAVKWKQWPAGADVSKVLPEKGIGYMVLQQVSPSVDHI